jgi:hypothetical protein
MAVGASSRGARALSAVAGETSPMMSTWSVRLSKTVTTVSSVANPTAGDASSCRRWGLMASDFCRASRLTLGGAAAAAGRPCPLEVHGKHGETHDDNNDHVHSANERTAEPAQLPDDIRGVNFDEADVSWSSAASAKFIKP